SPHPPTAQPDGILLVDKPLDWTSHDVVNFVRRRFHLKKTGHCGTLDPFATGLLVLLVGKATKLQDQLMASEKTYSGVIRLGVETDSQDRTGQVLATHEIPADLTLAKLQQVADTFLGEQLQTPPMHSALKLNGQPLYKLARKGQTVEREPRPVTIRSFQLLSYQDGECLFIVRCSKGTYVRTLAADFGDRLCCGAHLKELRREASGKFRVTQAANLDDLRSWTEEDFPRHLLLPVVPETPPVAEVHG
ncbi:MAG: tRNA pseudouridine(55) synthase TruB, partial [Victivallales bacterium]|nr:tRNA pseudouridine(55) synthase TruB [Victivallales bacterium]